MSVHSEEMVERYSEEMVYCPGQTSSQTMALVTPESRAKLDSSSAEED